MTAKPICNSRIWEVAVALVAFGASADVTAQSASTTDLSSADPIAPTTQTSTALSPARKIDTLSIEALTEKYSLPLVTTGETMSLADALTLANERNLDLQAMKTDLAVAQGRIKAAWGAVLPVIQEKMGYTVFDHEDPRDGLVVNPQHDVGGGIEKRNWPDRASGFHLCDRSRHEHSWKMSVLTLEYSLRASCITTQ